MCEHAVSTTRSAEAEPKQYLVSTHLPAQNPEEYPVSTRESTPVCGQMCTYTYIACAGLAAGCARAIWCLQAYRINQHAAPRRCRYRLPTISPVQYPVSTRGVPREWPCIISVYIHI
jgi:hypothetical protein